MVLIGHDMDFVAENCERGVCLEALRLRFDGPVAELFTRAKLLRSCGLLPCRVARLRDRFAVRPERCAPDAFLAALGGRGGGFGGA
ncbi:hypothetical protein [Pseudodesulfovibrio mercurii]|uniref:hypothetical protein n=1 Tax=Pseudodesulfovibrio mercurii TaxID=641491 RepID=UPI000306696B|nr:hypothetical protein [Pseudodesulfovibrio mercurii]